MTLARQLELRQLLGGLALCGAAAAILLAGTASAQEPPLTEREKALQERVNNLEQRLADLEKRLEAAPPAPASAQPATATPAASEDLTTRVSKIEDTLAKNTKKPTDLKAAFKNGLRFESEDGNFKLQVGGRLLADWAFFDQDKELKRIFGDEEDGAEFRVARINLQGSLYGNIEYRTEYEFSGNTGDAKFKDVYLGLTDLPYVGNLRVGHFREPFGMERLTRPDFTTFMERALPAVFTPDRNMGVMLYDAPLDGRLTWAIGAFKNTDDNPSINDSDEDQGYSITARVTGLPYYKEDGRKLLHLGLAYSHRNPDGAAVTYSSRPEVHLAKQYLNTEGYKGFRIADARADDINEYGAELLFIYGPFSVQGECMLSDVDTTFGGDRSFDGYYLETSYFLTGENRVFTKDGAVPGRVIPKHNFALGEDRGWGAWQVALRYSALDLDSGNIRGGHEENWTAGLNWYLNPNTRVSWNYVLANIEHDLYDGALNVFQTRFQIDF